MAIYRLDKRIQFPDPSEAEPDGLLAFGGDLSRERLLAAYSNGIFPWFSDDGPYLWFSPDPRMILLPEAFKCSKSLQRTLRSQKFEVRIDTNFAAVIAACSKAPRPGQDGTWITDEMIAAYIDLHLVGFAHSFETYQDGELVGGLYGVSLGKAFFGESMFRHIPDASKVAFAALVSRCCEQNFTLIDAQMPTKHLESLGARPVPRSDFLNRLHEALASPTDQGSWRKS